MTTTNKKGSKRCLFLERQCETRLCRSLGAVFLTELVDATGGIHDFLRAGVERVALGTNFDVQRWLAHHGLGLEAVAATAGHGEFLVIRVDVCFHFLSLRVVWCGGCTHFRAGIIHKNSVLRKFLSGLNNSGLCPTIFAVAGS
jgi:hypothetical protein